MKQKVSIARAIIHDPPVLIFDEATSGLDILVAREVLDTIEHLADHGKCIIFSTHIMSEVQRLCDRIAIMSHGNILAEGTIDELIEDHEQPDLEELFYRLISDSEQELQRV
jgi:sodium transport system ATP-binding protein